MGPQARIRQYVIDNPNRKLHTHEVYVALRRDEEGHRESPATEKQVATWLAGQTKTPTVDGVITRVSRGVYVYDPDGKPEVKDNSSLFEKIATLDDGRLLLKSDAGVLYVASVLDV